MTHIAVLGGAGDPQVRRVLGGLQASGIHVALVDTGRFPEDGALSLRDGALWMEGNAVPAPQSVYVRGLACHALMPSLADALEKTPRRVVVAMEEKRSFLESLLLLWETQGATLVNAPSANAQHARKPFQLLLLEAAGLPVPPWIATNDRKELQRWLDGTNAPCVYKPLAGGATVKLLGPDDLHAERLHSLATAPVLFQWYIESTSVRVYVVGGKVVAAAEIHSEHLDYRDGETAVTPTTLKPDEAEVALCAARVTGMPFAGVDLLRGSDRTWLLECNPSPMFAVFEEKTGLDVAGPLCEFLVSARA